MPADYQNHKDLFAIQKKVDDESGENKTWKTVIRGFHLHSLELLETVVEGSHTAVITATTRGKQHVAQFGVEMSQGNPSEFRGLLGARGIIIKQNDFKDFQELLVEWLQKIQDQQRTKRSFTNLGWMEKDTVHLGFAHGDTAYYPNGKHESGIRIANSTTGSSNMARHFVPQGNIQPWRDVSSFLAKQGNQALLAILATSFASPLMKFSGHSGAVVSIVSTASGVGKSSALVVSQSVWGRPGTTVHAATDTIPSLASKMGFTNRIKGDQKIWKSLDMIYQVTQGKEKSRLYNTGIPRRRRCLAIVAANDSIFEVMKRYNGDTDSGVTRYLILSMSGSGSQHLRSVQRQLRAGPGRGLC